MTTLRKLVTLVVVDRVDVVAELLGEYVPLARDLLARLAEVGDGEEVSGEPLPISSAILMTWILSWTGRKHPGPSSFRRGLRDRDELGALVDRGSH